MRTIVIFILLFSFGANAQTILDRKLSNWECDGYLIDCLNGIEVLTKVKFSYKQSAVEGLRSTIKTDQNTTLEQALRTLCEPHRLSYELHGDNKIAISELPSLQTTILGLVLDYSNGEVIQEAKVYVEGSDKSYYTDQFGLFRFQAPKDSFEINIIHEGYQMMTANVVLGAYTYYVFKMNPLYQFQAIDINPNDSAVKLNSKAFDEIDPNSKPIPGFGGETDALSNMKLKGGIQNVGLGDLGLIVRGGGPDQNFILIDGIPVYNTFHILGLYSIFNSSTINSIKLYKDAFPSRYGSRLSSVVDVSLYNGNKNKLSGDADIGIVSSGFSLNGPIVKDKLSFSLAARRTYADLLTYPVQNFLNQNEVQENTTGLWYYDVFSKLHFQANKKSQFKLTFYNGGDALKFDSKLNLLDDLQTTETTSGDLKWRNTLVGGQWHYVFSPSLFLKVQSAYSAYQMEFSDAYSLQQGQSIQSNQVSYGSGLSEWRNTIDFDHFSGGQNHILFGAGIVNYTFKPFSQSYQSNSSISNTDTVVNINQLNSQEIYAYFEDNIYLKSGLLSAGIRISRFTTANRNYVNIQPRLFLTKNLNKNTQFRFSITDMAQFLHLLPNNNLGLPIDIWLPVTEEIEPLRSFQISTGIKYSTKYLQLGASIFAKNYRNLIEHKTGSNFLLSEGDWTENIAIGTGSSNGFELQFESLIKKWDLAGSYTYCRSTRNFFGINNNGTFNSKYDRPHSLNIYGEYDFNEKTSVSISFTFASGNPITIPSSRYVTIIGGKEVVVEEFNEINNYRLPATHHLDIAFKHKKAYKNFNTDFVFGIYNLYNQLNPFMVYIGVDEKVEPVLKLRSYLPMMPMLKYHISF